MGVWNEFVPAAKAHPAFEVENVLALKEHLTRSGVTTEDDQPLPGANRFYVKDPFGNRIEFLEWVNR